MKVVYSKNDKVKKVYLPFCLLKFVVYLRKFDAIAAMSKEDLHKIIRELRLAKKTWKHLEIISIEDKFGKKISVCL